MTITDAPESTAEAALQLPLEPSINRDADDRPAEAPTRRRPRRRRTIVAVVLLAVACAEIVAGVFARSLPHRGEWYSPVTEAWAEFIDDGHLAVIDPTTVFMGSSMTGAAVSEPVWTATTGEVGTNVALPGADFDVDRRWLMEEILQHVDPERVVLGVSTLAANANRPSPTGERYENQLALRDGLPAAIDRTASRWSAIVRHREDWRHPRQTVHLLRNRTSPSMKGRGWLLDDGPVVTADFDDDAVRLKGGALRDFAIDDHGLETLRVLIGDLRAQGRAVDIVFMPVTTVYADAHPNGQADIDAVRLRYETIARSEGATFHDLSQAMDDRWFIDNVHLSVAGASEFTRLLAETIGSNADLPRR